MILNKNLDTGKNVSQFSCSNMNSRLVTLIHGYMYIREKKCWKLSLVVYVDDGLFVGAQQQKMYIFIRELES